MHFTLVFIFKMLPYYFLFVTCFLIYETLATNNNSSHSFFNFNNNACYKYYKYPFYATSKDCFESPYVLKDTPKLIEIVGYKYEAHNVTTEDGYINTIFRVFKDSPKGQPVYIQHGFLADSSTWTQNGKNSLAFVLVEAGYDVWLGNIRTSMFGKKHVSLSPEDSKFWNFSLDELSKYDLRNSFQKVAEITNQAGNIIYIGHSMGTTMIFMYASSFPSDNLLKGICALSPVVYVGTTLSTKINYYGAVIFAKILKSIGVKKLLYNESRLHPTVVSICRLVPHLCLGYVNLALGKSKLFLPEQLTTYFSYFPDTFGINQVIQLFEPAITNKFRKFDYGQEENMRRYQQKEPPLYDLSKITLPTYLFYGHDDVPVEKKAVNRLFKELGSKTKDLQAVPINDDNKQGFGHIEFLIGANITHLFYEDLIKYLRKLN